MLYKNPSNDNFEMNQIIAETRELVRKATELLLRTPMPDTFLGRKSQEPFPKHEADLSM